jgi:hypothetical protein
MTALGEFDPLTQVAIALLTGGVAFTSHSMKAATRLAVNQSPEPVSNSLLSLAGDVAVPVGVWLAMEHPLLIGSIAALCVVLFLIIAPRIFRLLRVLFSALRALIRSRFGTPDDSSLPEAYAERLRRELGLRKLPPATRAVATQGSGGLKNSLGYLVFLEDEAVFITRRWFRYHTHRVPLSDTTSRQQGRGFLLDRLTIRHGDQTCQYSLFKDNQLEVAPEAVSSTSRP